MKDFKRKKTTKKRRMTMFKNCLLNPDVSTIKTMSQAAIAGISKVEGTVSE